MDTTMTADLLTTATMLPADLLTTATMPDPNTAAQWTIIQPATPPLDGRTRARLRPDGAILTAKPEEYAARIAALPHDRWAALYAPHRTPDVFSAALAACRAYKAAKEKYISAGQPASWQPRLNTLRQAMQDTLAAHQFASPVELWQEYQQWQWRTPDGYAPAHQAHIDQIQDFINLCAMTDAPNPFSDEESVSDDRGTGSPDYAPTSTSRAELTEQIRTTANRAHALIVSKRIEPERIKATRDPSARTHRQRAYNRLQERINALLTDDYYELKAVVYPDRDAADYNAEDAAYAMQIAMADYGLIRDHGTPAERNRMIDVTAPDRTAAQAETIQALGVLWQSTQDALDVLKSTMQPETAATAICVALGKAPHTHAASVQQWLEITPPEEIQPVLAEIEATLQERLATIQASVESHWAA